MASLRVLGELVLTAGPICLLFVVYEVWVTELISGREQAQIAQTLHKN